MRKAEEIPEGERKYLFPDRKDVFETDGIFYIYMGRWAGWQTAEKIHIFPDGTVSALNGILDAGAAVLAARRILRTGFS